MQGTVKFTAGARTWRAATGVTMPGKMAAMRTVLLSAAAAAAFVTTTYTQSRSILGPPSEANHFIETPDRKSVV